MGKNGKMIPIDREVIEKTAQVLGPLSACAQALKDADEYGGPVTFYKLGNTILVQKGAAVAKRKPRRI